MTPEIIAFEHISTTQRNVWGGTKVEVEYSVRTKTGFTNNEYIVKCGVRGLATGEPYMDWSDAQVEAVDNNSETLVTEEILDLIQDYKQ